MFLPHAPPELYPGFVGWLTPIEAHSHVLGVVMAWLVICVLASLWVRAYEQTRHAALRSLWLVAASAAALQPTLAPTSSIPARWAALALMLCLGCSMAFWNDTVAPSPRSGRQHVLERLGLIACMPAALGGAWGMGSAVRGLLFWHLAYLGWSAASLLQQCRGDNSCHRCRAITPMLLMAATVIQHLACLGWLPHSTPITAVWQWVMIFGVGQVAMGATLRLPHTLRQALVDRDWQQALQQRYQEASSQRLVQYTEDLRRALQKAQRIDTLQRDMLALVAQEFRMPATRIIKVLACIRVSATPAPELWDSLGKAAERVQFLSTQLLDHERWRTEGLAPQFTALNLHAWLQTLLANEPAFRSLPLTPPQTTLTVEADPVLLDIAVRQLLQGALGTSPCQMHLRLSHRAGLAVLSFECDAVNFSAMSRARAFDRHLNLSSDPQSGPGLGLVRAIALLHDGQASLAATKDGGTRLSLSLPLAPERCHPNVRLHGS